MKVCLHSVSYSGTVTADQATLSLDEYIHKAKELGFDGIALAAKRPHALPLDLSSEDRESIRNLADSLGLEIAAIMAYNDFADPSAFNRQLNLSYVVDCIRLASDLGAPIVRTFASGMRRTPHEAPFYQQIGWVVEMAKEAAKVAEELGATVVLQNHHPIANNIYNLVHIVEAVDSPAYRAAVDCSLLSMSGMGIDFAEALHACRDIQAFTTASGHKRALGQYADGVPVGEADADYPRFLELLKEIGYDFWINHEMCSRMHGGGSEENLDRIASESLRYLRHLVEEIYGD